MPTKRPGQRLADILENITRIESYVEGLTLARFESDTMRIDAVERCLARISEAAVKLGDDAETLAPEVPWRELRGLGNILRHEYSVVDTRRLWLTIEKDLAPLKVACQRALAVAKGK